uniref:transforming growth factor-beta-induced protein ig-h3-like n=1 Tax=Myxine glutinosa TaxID=7769 RepID=UPI00358F734A
MAFPPLGESSAFSKVLRHSLIRGRAQGENVCALQRVQGTDQTYYTTCKQWHRREVCGQPTVVTYECCPGYTTADGLSGCPVAAPLYTIYNTLPGAGAPRTRLYSKQAGLTPTIDKPGAYTMFAPSDMAWDALPKALHQSLVSNVNIELLNTLHYHMLDHRYLSVALTHGSALKTLYQGLNLYIQHYPNGIITVNCARITNTDQLASNGVVHTINRVLTTVSSSLFGLLDSDPNLETFLTVVSLAGMEDVLDDDGPFTLLAPTDEAFSQIPRATLDRILADPETLRALLNNHILSAVRCSEAVLGVEELSTISGHQIPISCQNATLSIGLNATVLRRDLVATNGVVHILDRVLIPDSAHTVIELAETQGANSMLDAFKRAGLLELLQAQQQYTLLVPDHSSFLDPTVQAVLEVNQEKVLLDHVIKQRLRRTQLHHGQILETLGGTKLRVFAYRKAMCIENACLGNVSLHASDGELHRVNSVILAPTKNAFEMLAAEPQLTMLVSTLKTAGITEEIANKERLTFFAPSNEAFAKMTPKRRRRMFANREDFATLLRSHMASKMLVSGGVVGRTTTMLTSLAGLKLRVNKRNNTLYVNDVRVTQADLLATNGVIHITDAFLLPGLNTRAKAGRTGLNLQDRRMRKTLLRKIRGMTHRSRMRKSHQPHHSKKIIVGL